MFSQRALSSILLVALLALAGWTASSLQFDIHADQPDSRLWVTGTSTVHDWECEAEAFAGNLVAASDETSDLLNAIHRVEVTVPATQISCKNSTMDGKASDALKVKKNPTITYSLTNAKVIDAGDGTLTMETTGDFSMAGATRSVTMLVEGTALPSGDYQFTGSTQMKLSDFNIDRPSAMFGTIKTGDEIGIHVDVRAAVRN